MMPTKTDSLRYDIGELMKAGAFSEIIDRCHVELTLARREKRERVEVIALLGLAEAQCSLGHFAFARDYVAQALDRAAEIRSISQTVDALLVRARIAREGFFQTAEAHDDYQRAVDLAFEAGDMRRYGRALLGLGEIAAKPSHSSKHAWRVIDIAREANDSQMEARAILLLSNAFIRQSDYKKANDGLLVALRKAQTINDRLLESLIIGQQGLVLAQEGDTFQRGIEQQLTALKVARGFEAIFHEFMRLYTLAMTMLAADDFAEARNYFDQLLALAQDVEHKPYEMYTLGMLGQWHEHNDKLDIASAYYDRAIKAAREVGNPAYEARYLYALGMVYQSQWDFHGARGQFVQARAIYRSLEDGANASRVSASILYSYILAFASRIMKLVGIRAKGD